VRAFDRAKPDEAAMTDLDLKFWAYKPRLILAAAVAALVGLLLATAALRAFAKWPIEQSGHTQQWQRSPLEGSANSSPQAQIWRAMTGCPSDSKTDFSPSCKATAHRQQPCIS
jgi:hypothetical protein